GVNAISMNSGRKIYEEVFRLWPRHGKIIIDFDGVEVFASPYFNSSIGVLLKDRSISTLQERLAFENISEHGRRILNLVIDNAIKFYSDQDGKTDTGLDEVKREL